MRIEMSTLRKVNDPSDTTGYDLVTTVSALGIIQGVTPPEDVIVQNDGEEVTFQLAGCVCDGDTGEARYWSYWENDGPSRDAINLCIYNS